MGTNYYAEWRPNGNRVGDGPAEVISQPFGIRLHICKSHTSFQGKVFNSWSAWRNFLESNEPNVTVVDEYGGEWAVAEFVQSVESTGREQRGRQHKWMVDHYKSHERLNDWADADGFSFHRGEFC